MMAVESWSGYHTHVNDERFFKQRPHVIGRVNFFHFNFCIYIAVVQEVYVSFFHLKLIRNYSVRFIVFMSFKSKCTNCTSGMQSGCDTMDTISSNGRRLWHLISVFTFLPIVQHANNLTNSTWYLKRKKNIKLKEKWRL